MVINPKEIDQKFYYCKRTKWKYSLYLYLQLHYYVIKKVGSQDACAELCLATHGTYFWSYVPAQGYCYVWTDNLNPRPYAYAVSGNRECGRH